MRISVYRVYCNIVRFKEAGLMDKLSTSFTWDVSLWKWQRECVPDKAESSAVGQGSSPTEHVMARTMVRPFSVLVLPALSPPPSYSIQTPFSSTWANTISICHRMFSFILSLRQSCVCSVTYFFFFFLNAYVTCLLNRNQRCILWLKLEHLWHFFIPGGFISQTQTSSQASCVSCTDRLYL